MPRGTCTAQPGVAEVALQLAQDRGHRVGREGRPAGGVEAVDRLHEPDAGDLHEVVEGLVGALVAARELARERQEALDQLLARGRRRRARGSGAGGGGPRASAGGAHVRCQAAGSSAAELTSSIVRAGARCRRFGGAYANHGGARASRPPAGARASGAAGAKRASGTCRAPARSRAWVMSRSKRSRRISALPRGQRAERRLEDRAVLDEVEALVLEARARRPGRRAVPSAAVRGRVERDRVVGASRPRRPPPRRRPRRRSLGDLLGGRRAARAEPRSSSVALDLEHALAHPLRDVQPPSVVSRRCRFSSPTIVGTA